MLKRTLSPVCPTCSGSLGAWWIGAQNEPVATNDNDLYFEVEYSNGNTHVAAIILDQRTNVFMNFTGQHRCKYDEYNENRIGLIVKSTGTYTNLDNSNEPTINDSLCNIELTSKKNDFGNDFENFPGDHMLSGLDMSSQAMPVNLRAEVTASTTTGKTTILTTFVHSDVIFTLTSDGVISVSN